MSRSKAIDVESGHLENATKLLDYAIDNGLRDEIAFIQDEATYFSEFAYDPNTDCRIGLADFLELDPPSRLEVLVDYSNISRLSRLGTLGVLYLNGFEIKQTLLL